MPTFLGRKYLRGKPGWTERFIGLFLFALLAAIVGAFLLSSGLFAGTVDRVPRLRRIKDLIAISETPLFEATHAATAAATKTHFPPIPGSEVFPPPRIRSYQDDLYEKIDGKEGMFRAYYFQELLFGQYGDALGETLYDVYVFDMSAPENAMGIYMAERSRSAKLIPLGREGYASDTNTYFWKDRYYVNVLGPPEGGPKAGETSRRIAAAVAETMTDAGEPFWAEAFLPTDDRQPDSLSYQATSALGYDFLSHMFFAQYETDGKPYQMFLTRTEDPAIARDLFERFLQSTAKYDKVVSKQDSGGAQRMVGESLGVFAVAFSKGIYFGGVVECEDQALAVRQASVLCDRVPGASSAPDEPRVSTRAASSSVPSQPEEHRASYEN